MENQEQSSSMGTKQYYVLGLIVLVAVVIAGYLLRSKSASTPTPEQAAQIVTPAPTPGPITQLACDSQYYNPVIGFPRYYLSVDGGDISKATKVDCIITVSVDKKVVATQTVSSPLTDMPQRGGSTFRCSTPVLELTPNVPTTVDVVLKDDLKATSTCSSTFLFPAP
jgi:hypothetical protein